jgi:hypothetical protein
VAQAVDEVTKDTVLDVSAPARSIDQLRLPERLNVAPPPDHVTCVATDDLAGRLKITSQLPRDTSSKKGRLPERRPSHSDRLVYPLMDSSLIRPDDA